MSVAIVFLCFFTLFARFQGRFVRNCVFSASIAIYCGLV
uniref:Uncharacterized protein n=1 Tax=uncultured bacterium contig00115 TaxID=1181577 RepID=A0A806KI13_9BACT|nr:hypothetical protein [uncultured bacterium contig00115]